MKVKITFSCSDATSLALEWQLLDTSTATSWMSSMMESLQTTTASAVTTNGLALDNMAAFCGSDSEAEQLWHSVRSTMLKHRVNIQVARRTLHELNRSDMDKIKRELNDAVGYYFSKNSAAFAELSAAAELAIKLNFWFENTESRNLGATCWGNLEYYFQGTMRELTADDLAVLTTDIQFGHLYAVASFAGIGWYDLAQQGEGNDFHLITEGKVGAPKYMAAGLQVPFYPDIAGSDIYVMGWFDYYRAELEAMGLTVEGVIAEIGKLPVASLITVLGDTGITYDQLKTIKYVDNIEFITDEPVTSSF